MSAKVSPIPQGLPSMIPNLTVDDGARALDFYKAVFGAEEVMRMPGPDGKGVMHATLRIGSAMLYLADTWAQSPSKPPKALGGTTSSLYLYVNDVDAVFDRAIKAGATVKAPLTDMFWGDRWGMVEDPFGHVWQLATHIEDVTPEQMRERSAANMAILSKQGGS